MNPRPIVRGCAVAAVCLLAASAIPGPAGRSPAAPSGLLGCSPDCEGAIPENETCGLDANNGCHGSGLLGNVYCGKPVCGELSVDKNGGVFDVDWFTLDISYYTTLVKITASVAAEMPVDLSIVDGADLGVLLGHWGQGR